jgi:hypothetical protein
MYLNYVKYVPDLISIKLDDELVGEKNVALEYTTKHLL